MADRHEFPLVIVPDRGPIALIRLDAADLSELETIGATTDPSAQIDYIVKKISGHPGLRGLDPYGDGVRQQIRDALAHLSRSRFLPYGAAHIIRVPGTLIGPTKAEQPNMAMIRELKFLRERVTDALDREAATQAKMRDLLRQMEQIQSEYARVPTKEEELSDKLRGAETVQNRQAAELQSLTNSRTQGETNSPNSAKTNQTEHGASTKDVRFTSFLPSEAAPGTWYTLLVYAHSQGALDQVRANAAKFSDELGNRPVQLSTDEPVELAPGTEFTIQPEGPGVVFEPRQIRLRWRDNWQRASFRLEIDRFVSSRPVPITITVYVGPLIVTTLTATISPTQSSILQSPHSAETTAKLYSRIFTSYSHADSAVVFACRSAYKALGLDVMTDVDTLRAGEHYDPALMRMIETSDIFQLFWSKRSAKSKYVRREWEHALKHYKGEGYIRPVYWELPMARPPRRLNHLHFVFVQLPTFQTPSSILAFANTAS